MIKVLPASAPLACVARKSLGGAQSSTARRAAAAAPLQQVESWRRHWVGWGSCKPKTRLHHTDSRKNASHIPPTTRRWCQKSAGNTTNTPLGRPPLLFAHWQPEAASRTHFRNTSSCACLPPSRAPHTHTLAINHRPSLSSMFWSFVSTVSNTFGAFQAFHWASHRFGRRR
jgi:hypothetical protein